MGNAKKIKFESLIERQYRAECQFMQDFEQHDYTFENPKIVLNPYLINPCSALILFRTSEPVKVTVCAKGKTPGADISHTYERNTVHILPVLGLYDDAENTVELRLYQGETRQIRIQTQGHPGSTKVISMNAKPEHLKGRLVLLSPAISGFPTGIDANGDIRWYLSENTLFVGKKLKNGHFMIGTERKMFSPYYPTGVYEMDLIGKIYREYCLPGLYHHDHLELENGDLAILSDDFSEGSDSVEDICVIVDRESGEVKKSIDLRKILPRGRALSGCGTWRDWFHNNSVSYDGQNHSLLLSGRHMDAIVSIGLDTGKINWILGDPDTWPEEMKELFFTPKEGNKFEWQYGQHAAAILPDGDILCFDNGNFRSKYNEHYLPNRDNYSRGVRYRLNLKEKTVEQVWQYGKERGTRFFSQFISNVEYCGENDYLVHSGGIQLMGGVSVEGVLPPNLWDEGEVISDTVEVMDGRVIWEMKVRNNFYRASLLNLYEEGDNLTLGKGARLGRLFRSAWENVPEFSEPQEDVPENVMLHIVDESDFFEVKGRFDDNADVVLYLAGPDETIARRIPTKPEKYDAVSCLPYIPADPRNKSLSLTKEGLSGNFQVYLSIDGRLYRTSIELKAE